MCENKEKKNAPFLSPEPSLALFSELFSLFFFTFSFFFFENVSGSFHPLCRISFSQRQLQFERRRRLCPAEKRSKKKKKNFTKTLFRDEKKKSLLLFAPTAGLKESVKVGETVTKPKETSDFTSCAGRRGQIKTLL